MPLPKVLVVFLSWICFACGSAGIGTSADDPAVQAKKLAEIEQFAAVLEKDPRPGIAFDQVFAFHTKQGTLDQLRETYLGRAAAATGGDGASFWIIVGMIDLQRGRDVQAIAAFTHAEKITSDNFMASFRLGQSQLQAFQSMPAARSLERALLKQASPTDMKDACQLLGRIYRRSHQNEKALDLWKRMETLFPGDTSVMEQIATTLVEENSLELALPRFQELGRITNDKQRQIHFLMEAADIKSRLGQSAAALADFDGLLNQLSPDDASFREIRRRIEAMYMTRDDRIGLIKYYERRVEEHPADWDAVIRLARRLMEVGRGHEAQQHLERELKGAPSNNQLRQILIGHLLRREKYSEAMTHYAEMDKYEPGNAEIIRDWGRAILNGPADEPDKQKQMAAAVWRKLLTVRPNDAATAAFVADLFRQARMHDDALALYRRAIELAPDTVKYYEQIGDCQMQLKQTSEALATWRDMTAGNRRTAANLSRLSEILSRQELLPEALEAIREACEVDQKDFTLHLKYVDLLMRTNRAEEALAQSTILEKLAVTEEERDNWIERGLQVQKDLGRLAQRIVEVQKTLERSPPDDPIQEAKRWQWLARAQEKAGQLAFAVVSIRRALKLNPDSIPILIATARVNESHQNLNVAIEFCTRLTKVHRRSRSDYLKRIVTL
ncbi:MAG: tetratricopeptide repeat protein, partial [Planctomycetota bacterium]